MGRTAERSGPCLAPHLPPALPLHPAIPAGRSPWRSDHRSRRRPRQPLSPPSGRPPHRLASPLLPAHFAPCPVLVIADLLPLFSPPPLRHRSIVLLRHPPPAALRLTASLRSAPLRTDVPEDRHSHPLRSCLQERPSCQANPTSTSARAASRPGFPLQSPLRSDFRSNPSRLRSLTLAARSACRKPRSPTGTVYRPVPDHLSGPPTRPPPVSVPPPLRPPPPPPRPIAAATPHRRSRRPRWPDRSCTGP